MSNFVTKFRDIASTVEGVINAYRKSHKTRGEAFLEQTVIGQLDNGIIDDGVPVIAVWISDKLSMPDDCPGLGDAIGAALSEAYECDVEVIIDVRQHGVAGRYCPSASETTSPR